MSTAKNKFLFLILLTLFLVKPFAVFAQVTSSGVAINVPIADDDAQDGDIVCTDVDSLKLCDENFSNSMYGVISDNPAAAFENDELENAHLVSTSGKVKVRVNTSNGAITAGDLLTSSETKGVAVKADRNGYVIGTSMEDFDLPSDQTGSVLVAINIHPTVAFTDDRSNLVELLRTGLAAPLLTPLSALRYILAGFVTTVSFILGFIYFGRVARAAVEAVGRNPLARRTIQFALVFNILVMIVVFLGGIGIAYLILAL